MHDAEPATAVDWRTRVAVIAEPAEQPELIAQRDALAQRLRIARAGDVPLLLVCAPTGLELRQPGTRTTPFRVDLTTLDTRPGPGGRLDQPLLRAVGIRKREPARPLVLDATAGLGEDAWLLAAAGCSVVALERHPLVFALLDDALSRAARAVPEIARRIQPVHADASHLLVRFDAAHVPPPLEGCPQVITIDPMFPSKRKTAERKPMRLLRQLVGDDADAEQLLRAARHAAEHQPVRRIVVKRPNRAAPLDATPPSTSHRGKAIRYDVYATGR